MQANIAFIMHIPKKSQLARPLPRPVWLHDHSIVADNKVSPDHQLLNSPILWRWTVGIDKAIGRYWHSTPEIDPQQTGVQ